MLDIRKLPSRSYIRVLLASGVAVLATGLALTDQMVKPDIASAKPDIAETVVIQTRPLEQTLALTGAIAIGAHKDVVVPYDGFVSKTFVTIGDAVRQGSPLFELDQGDLNMQIRDATTAFLKAQQAVNDLKNWASSPDVEKAKRGVLTAQTAASKAARDAADAKRLYTNGIIARQEYESAEQQRETAVDQYASAKEDLRHALEQGDAEASTIADLTFKNAAQKLDMLKSEAAAALVRSPADGIVLKPDVPATDPRAATPQAGQRVSRGQALYVIGDETVLQVRAQVDEVDEPQLALGQAGVVTGDAFPGVPLKGHVQSISMTASDESSNTKLAQYLVVIALDPMSPPTAKRLKLGMTANATIVLSKEPDAITVPPTAVQSVGQTSFVLVRDSDGHFSRRVVVVGKATADGVQIDKGLSNGDVVAIPKGAM